MTLEQGDRLIAAPGGSKAAGPEDAEPTRALGTESDAPKGRDRASAFTETNQDVGKRDAIGGDRDALRDERRERLAADLVETEPRGAAADDRSLRRDAKLGKFERLDEFP